MDVLKSWKAACLAVLLALTPAVAAEQPYPTKQAVKIILPFAAGSATDAFARLMAAELQKEMGASFIVENRPGFVGITGTAQAATSPPDGYTLVLTSGAQHSLPKWLYKDVPYDAVNDFEHIVKIGEIGFVLLVNPGVPAKTLQEFVAYAKANPGKLNYGYGTTSAQLGVIMLNLMAGLNTEGIPYKGQPPALTDLIAGRIQFIIADILVASPFITGGELRALAVTPKSRIGLVPNIATIAELGFPDYDYASWVGLAAPRGTPKAIVDSLNAASLKILKKPEVIERLQKMGIDVKPNSPSEQKEFVRTTQARMGEVVKGAGIQPQ